MLVNESQPQNADLPILVTLFGITMLVNDEQPRNAPYKILPPVIVTDFKLVSVLLVFIGGIIVVKSPKWIKKQPFCAFFL